MSVSTDTERRYCQHGDTERRAVAVDSLISEDVGSDNNDGVVTPSISCITLIQLHNQPTMPDTTATDSEP